MNLSFIGSLIERGLLSKSWGRVLEISIYGFFVSLLAYLGDSLTSGVRTNRRVALGGMFTTFTVSVISGIQKNMRDKLLEKKDLLETIETDGDGTTG